MPRVQLKIKQNDKPNNMVPSTIASFPNGPLTKNMLHEVKWRVTGKKHPNNSKMRMKIHGKKGKIEWSGIHTSNDKMKSTNGGYNYFVAVYNKKSKKMEMFQTNSKNVIPMTQQVAVSNGSLDNLSNSLAYMGGRQRRAVLTHSFGSRMARKGLKDLEMNAVTEDNIVGLDEIEQHLLEEGYAANARYENAGMKSEAEIGLYNNRKNILPYFDMEATDPNDAYPFKNMVSARESSAFKELIVAMENATNDEKIQELRDSEDRKWKEQILRRLPKVHNKFQGVENKKRRNIEFQKLLFQQCLLRFYWLGKKIKVQGSLETLVEKRNIPISILTKFLSLFSDKQSRRHVGHDGGDSDQEETTVYFRSPFHTKKLILYICIVTLMVEGYRNYDPSYLAKDLKISMKDMLRYFKEVGAKYEKYKKDNINAAKKVRFQDMANIL